MSKKIFISHTTKDDDFVTELRKALENQGLDVWVDSQDLRGGDRLKVEIESAIKDAAAFIVVISPNVFNTKWVRQEVLFALESNVTIVPLLIDGMGPDSLLFFSGMSLLLLKSRITYRNPCRESSQLWVKNFLLISTLRLQLMKSL